jgi:hypothetical protein
VYSEPYLTLYGTKAVAAVRQLGWEVAMPLGGKPEGLMLDRIAALIDSAERAIYEVGFENGNVWFELGISLGRRQPVALTTSREPRELPDILRSPWLRPYRDDDSCLNEIRGFLSLATPPPIVSASKTLSDAPRITVIGKSGRTAAVALALRNAGRSVTEVDPGAVRSLKEAIDVAESCGVLVCVRPATESWEGHEAIASLAILGAGFGLNREVVAAAGLREFVPSDCMQLLVRGADDADIAARVLASLERPRLAPPPAGTIRPRITGTLPRPQRVAVATAVRNDGRGLLDAEPGYGKTTLLDQAANELGWPTAWVTVDSDWSVGDILERLLSVLGEHAPGFGWRAMVELREAEGVTGIANDRASRRRFPSPEQLAELVVSSAAQTTAPDHMLLVIDDAHKATDEGGRLIARLAALAPPWLHLLIAGRGAPTEITKMAAAGKLATWGAEDLRFSREETAAYLQYSGRNADEDRVTLLHQRSEGWPAALAVIRAWLDNHPEASPTQLKEMTRGDRHQVYRVFATDYFAGLSEQIQNDLFAASVPMRLGPKVAGRLFGSDGALRLRELALGPYFLIEDTTGVFRMHSLFREFLSQRWIEQRGRDSLLETRSALAHWYQEEGDAASAYQIGCEAEDWDLAAAAIDPAIRVIANQGDAYFVLDLVGRLPEEHIRRSRPLWESWVRALSHTGDTRALEEARLLAAAGTASLADQAIADLLLAELKYERQELTDEQMAAACDAVADRLGDDNLLLALQARLLSIGTRTVHSGKPGDWPGFQAEALALADAAEFAEMPRLAAVACATAGDLTSRIFETALSSDVQQLKFIRSMGYEVALASRAERAKQLTMTGAFSVSLYRRAFELAKQAEDPLTEALVLLSFSRFKTFDIINRFWREGKIDDQMRVAAEEAISYAMQAADAYARRGVMRSVAIAVNAAAEAASAINERARLDALSGRAEAIAQQFGYEDLVQTARRIRRGPTAWESYQEATHPPPFHREDPAHLQEMIAQMLSTAGLTGADQQRVRPVLQRMMAIEVYLDSQREVVCQYLALLQDLRGPKIGPFDAEDPKWSVTCRMRGLSLIERHRKAQPLLRKFVSAFCSDCPFRSPASTRREFAANDEEIYAPLLERVTKEDAGTPPSEDRDGSR